MKPLERFYSIIFTFTTALVFAFWGFSKSVITKNPVLGIPIGSLIALGTYRMVLKFVATLISKVLFVKRFVFGRYYIQGVWVGFYLNNENVPIFFIENYEQELESLIVRGRAYFQDGKSKGSWESENVSIDIEKGIISYIYQTDMKDNMFINPGQARFRMIREHANKLATKLDGYTCDLHSNEKVGSMEIKVDDKYKYEEKELLEKAKKCYEDNKVFYSISTT